MKYSPSMAPWTIMIALVLALQLSGASLFMSAETAGAKAQEESAEDLAKKAQNPVADMISIPLQNNFNFNYGSQNHIQYVGNLQPVIPIHATENWNVITPTIMPIICQPQLSPNVGDVWGLGDIQSTAFLSPSKPGGTIWGVGPIIQAPSGTDNTTTSGKWAAGPSAAALRMEGHWVYGALANYLSSFAGQSDRRREPVTASALPKLQPARRLVSDDKPDHNGQHDGRRQPGVDGAPRGWRGQDRPDRQIALQPSVAGILQRGAPGRGTRVEHSVSDTASAARVEGKKIIQLCVIHETFGEAVKYRT